MTIPFAELVAATNYSFLRGASHPAEMVGQAIKLGMTGIGIADRNSVAGVVRAWHFLDKMRNEIGNDIADFTLVVGARLVFIDDTPDIIAYPATRHGWGRLTRLLTLGNRRAKKGDCILTFLDLLRHCQDLLLIVVGGTEPLLRTLLRARPGSVWIGITMPHDGSDNKRLAQAKKLSASTGAPLLATADAFYAEPEQRPLHDILTCIRNGVTIEQAGKLLSPNAEHHLKSPKEMARLFEKAPNAVLQTDRFLKAIDFRLEHLRYEYPHEPVPEGWQPQNWLTHLVMTAANKRYPKGIPQKSNDSITRELRLIGKKNYAYYFLTVHDIINFARNSNPPILCQGRGSAANSVVCYLLGITPIDPIVHKLLFTRFLSDERNEPPDIDIDFEHDRREEVIQYIYQRYGRERAGIAATIIHYRPRSALREIGKALGLTEDVTARLSNTIWGHFSSDVPAQRFNEAGMNVANPTVIQLRTLVGQLLTFPRHLSQHVGGFILTQGRLDEMVPLHNGAMPGRTFIEWDKDDIDALNWMKVDVLALGMLTCIHKGFDLLRHHNLGNYTLDNIPNEDPAVYEMLRRGDSVGTFQVESRAQINMLPRMKPRALYDLVIQVAIVRPGPIQGGMVHPYLRRRNGEEEPEFPSPTLPNDSHELHEVLGRTLGVPLFQEQAMKLSIAAAGFTPDQADGLRRAMATFRHSGMMPQYESQLIEGMVGRGYQREFAERCFNQIKGFGEYGFPESHAQAFAWLAYVSSWLKCRHPAVFTCALLNSQPMGFYAPAQLIRDVQEHGIDVRAVDVNASEWDCTLEPHGTDYALRLGFRSIDGFRKDWGNAIVAARGETPFSSIEQFARRAVLPPSGLRRLADADGYGSLGKGRRDALWDVRRIPSQELPLFAYADATELAPENDAPLPVMPLSEEVVADYQVTRLSLKAHPMHFLRPALRQEGVLTCAEIDAAPDGRKVKAAGVVLIRQRPGKGNAVFITIEDETGIVNVLLWARDMEEQRRAVMSARMMVVEGMIQRSKEGVCHLMARRIVDRTDMLDTLSDSRGLAPPMARADEGLQPLPDQYPSNRGPTAMHPRDVRVLPKSRDFR